MTLIIRSVPMLPGADDRDLDLAHRDRSCRSDTRDAPSAGDLGRDVASPGATATIGPSAPDSTISPARSGAPYAPAVSASQADRDERMAEAGRAGADRDLLAVLRQRHPARRPGRGRRADRRRRRARTAPQEALSATVSTMRDVPVRDAAVDDLERGDARSRWRRARRPASMPRSRRGRGRARTRSRPRPSAAAARPASIGSPSAHGHVVEEHAEVGLVDAELALHRRLTSGRSCAPTTRGAGRDPAGDPGRLHGVGRTDVARPAAGRGQAGRHGAAGAAASRSSASRRRGVQPRPVLSIDIRRPRTSCRCPCR